MRAQVPANLMGTWSEFLAPSFSLAQARCYGILGEQAPRWKVSVSLRFCTFPIKEIKQRNKFSRSNT